jgi:NADP-dependent 3-hydroxy acid dehydrogenase YdfG
MGDSTERFAIVTGAGAGIGRATSLLLARQGWTVAAFDRDGAALAALVADDGGQRIIARELDVTAYDEWTGAVTVLGERSGGKLHLLVNNAGIITLGPFGATAIEQARRVVDVNVMGAVNGIHACLPLLEATPGARIVNVSSIAALTGWPYSSVYSATKAAVTNLTEALAAEFADKGIAVCDVLPSFVGKSLVHDDLGSEAVVRTFRKLGVNFTSPERIAGAIVATTTSRKMHHVVGGQARAYGLTTRLFPGVSRFFSRVLGRRLDRATRALSATAGEATGRGQPVFQADDGLRGRK